MITGQEHETIRQLTRDFCRKELAPYVAEFDDKEIFPAAIYHKFAETGLHALGLPEEYGGGGSIRALALMTEEVARVDPGFILSVLASSQLFGYNVSRLGTSEQKERYLKPLITEAKLGCWALTEPEIGSDAIGIKTRAQKKGDAFILNGSKTFITNAPIADYFIVLTREYGDGIEGGTAFILERSQPGMELGQPLKKLGHRTSPTGQIFLHECRVPASQLLGRSGNAFIDMKHSLDLERLVFSGIAVGVMRECLDRAVQYSVGRKQFGRSIAEFQLVQEKLAEMATRLELVTHYAEHIYQLYGDGKPIHFEAALFKYIGAEFCVEVADRAVQILGGNGYMREYFVEKLLRDARLFPIGGGTSEINKLIVAKEVLKGTR